MAWWERVIGRKEAPREPPAVLVVDDDPKILIQVKAALAEFGWQFLVAEDKAGALAILDREPRLVTALVDLYYPGDGDRSTGLEILAEVRRRYPHLRCAALTAGLRPNHINDVGTVDATYISKWELSSYLPKFATKILIANVTTDEPLRRCIASYATRFKLSIRETEIVALAAADVPRADLPWRTGTKNTTVKTQIRSILAKTKAKSIEAIGRTLRLEARESEDAIGSGRGNAG